MAKLPKATRKTLGQLLESERVLPSKVLDRYSHEARQSQLPLGDLLVDAGLISEEDVADLLSKQYSLPYLSPLRYRIGDAVRGLFSEEDMRQYHFIPLDLFADSLLVATSIGLEDNDIDNLEQICKKHLQVAIARSSDVRRAISLFFGKNG